MEEINQEDFSSPIADFVERRIKVSNLVFKKFVDIWYLGYCFTVEQYNQHIKDMSNSKDFELTKEEFDLLKQTEREVWKPRYEH